MEAYLAQGEFLDIDPKSFGAIGVIAIPEFARFYRHVLIGRQFPHHAAIAFKQSGKVLFDALQLFGLDDVHTPLPSNMRYYDENPFGG